MRDLWKRMQAVAGVCASKLKEQKGQGTTEYAILVGVLAVMAMVAIGLFKGKVQQLWDAISSGINGL